MILRRSDFLRPRHSIEFTQAKSIDYQLIDYQLIELGKELLEILSLFNYLYSLIS